MQNGRIKTLVAEDEVYYYELLKLGLERSGFEVVGIATDGASVIEMVEGFAPDVILLDIDLPGQGGMQVLSQLCELGHAGKVIVLTGYARPELLKRTRELGAAGYLTKAVNLGTISSAIRQVVNGGTLGALSIASDGVFVSEASAESLIGDRLIEGLTLQERRVLELLADGQTAGDIANRLAVSGNTVKTHLSHIYDKLGVSGRTQAAVWALRNGY